MAQCISCGSETSLYVNEQPLCLTCDDEQNTPAASRVPTAPSKPAEGFQALSHTAKAG